MWNLEAWTALKRVRILDEVLARNPGFKIEDAYPEDFPELEIPSPRESSVMGSQAAANFASPKVFRCYPEYYDTEIPISVEDDRNGSAERSS